MNVKINNKEKSDDRRANEWQPTFDENKFLTNCLTVAFDEIFLWRKFPAIQHHNFAVAIIDKVLWVQVHLPYCYYYLRVLYFANFCDLEKIAKLSTRKNFYQHIRHPGVYTITNCVMIFHFGSCMIFLFCSFLPKAQTNVLLALTNVLFLKANILEGSLNILFPVVYMNRTKLRFIYHQYPPHKPRDIAKELFFMSLKCKWVTGSQQCATVRNFCATPSARVDSISSLHLSQRLLAQRAEGFDLPVLIYLFENVPLLRSLTTETFGKSSLIFHHCRPVGLRVRQNDREREFVSQVLVHARTLFVFFF